MKKVNLWHIIWIIGIYLVLVAILYLVVTYKVKWQNKDLNKYLYFYKCSDTVCTTNNKVNEYYANILCSNDICPYIVAINNDVLILNNNDKEYLYNYYQSEVINDDYMQYKFTDDNNTFIVKNIDGKAGIINSEGNVLVPFEYDEIIDYKDGIALYENGNKEGIIAIDNDKIKLDAIYDEVILINNKYYAYKAENGYIINNYENNTPVNNNVYDFIHAYKDMVFISLNNGIDILDSNLTSKINNKITTYYTYKIEQERDSLRIKHDNNLFHFSIYNENNEYTNYIYDLKNKKLYG